jgi:AcrR family transcriptional regulator
MTLTGAPSPAACSPAQQDTATRNRVLDAAERLFGELGYAGTSVRAITRGGRANLGAITYHFGSKEALYLEALFRRLRPANTRRLAELAALRAQAGSAPLAVADVVRCLLRAPLLVAKEHPDFLPLLGRNLSAPPDFARAALRQEMDPLDGPFFHELTRAVPTLPPPLLQFRLILTGGGLFFLLHHWPQISAARAEDAPLPRFSPEIALELLVEFATAGLTTPTTVSLPLPR